MLILSSISTRSVSGSVALRFILLPESNMPTLPPSPLPSPPVSFSAVYCWPWLHCSPLSSSWIYNTFKITTVAGGGGGIKHLKITQLIGSRYLLPGRRQKTWSNITIVWVWKIHIPKGTIFFSAGVLGASVFRITYPYDPASAAGRISFYSSEENRGRRRERGEWYYHALYTEPT